MFIVAGLQPSEEATGGAWYTNGVLDIDLITVVGDIVEEFVSRRSWVSQVEDTKALTTGTNNKRKTPHDGFDVKGKGKAKIARIDDSQPRSESPEVKHKTPKHHKSHLRKTYIPQEPGYSGYPTLSDITRHVNSSNVTISTFPQNAIAQLLEIMVYDDRLFAVERPTRGDEVADHGQDATVTMYRCFKSPAAREKSKEIAHMFGSESPTDQKAARRHFELEEIGRGGTSEVPCLKCPAFGICGDGGPVNVKTCPYFDEWYVKAAKADTGADPWPGSDDFIREGEMKKDKRLKGLPAVTVEVEEKPLDLTKLEEPSGA